MGDNQRDQIMLNAIRFATAKFHIWSNQVAGPANTATVRSMMQKGVIDCVSNILLSERYAMAVLKQEYTRWRDNAEDTGSASGSDTAGRVVRAIEDAENYDSVVRTAIDAASRILGHGQGSVPATEAADDVEGGEGSTGGGGRGT